MNYEDVVKIDTHQTISESIQEAQDEDWNDSNYFESIQHMSESFHDTIQTILNRFKGDKIQNFMKRFTPSQKLLAIRFKIIWIDSKAWTEAFICKKFMQDTKNTYDTMGYGLLGVLTWFYAILPRQKINNI